VFEVLDFLARLAGRAFVMDDGCIAPEVDRDKQLNDPTLVHDFPGSGSEES
jgi:hypothetical protein